MKLLFCLSLLAVACASLTPEAEPESEDKSFFGIFAPRCRCRNNGVPFTDSRGRCQCQPRRPAFSNINSPFRPFNFGNGHGHGHGHGPCRKTTAAAAMTPTATTTSSTPTTTPTIATTTPTITTTTPTIATTTPTIATTTPTIATTTPTIATTP